MSLIATVTITGAKETAAKLDALEKKVRRKVVTQAIRAGAKVIQTRAKANAPVRTGLMKKKIVVRASKYIGNRRKKRGEVAINAQIGAGNFKGETFYGGFQEFGWRAGKRATSKTNIRDVKERRAIEGKHFMERAGKQGATEAISVITREISQGVEAAAK